MLNWTSLNTLQLKQSQRAVLSHSDAALDHHSIAKEILGLEPDAALRAFHFEIVIFGALSDCLFGAQFTYDENVVKTILSVGQAMPIAVAFEDSAQKADLLNLFDKEDEDKPTLDMLINFVRSNYKSFQKCAGSADAFWIGEWSDVNNWCLYWHSGESFYCLGKMVGG